MEEEENRLINVAHYIIKPYQNLVLASKWCSCIPFILIWQKRFLLSRWWLRMAIRNGIIYYTSKETPFRMKGYLYFGRDYRFWKNWLPQKPVSWEEPNEICNGAHHLFFFLMICLGFARNASRILNGYMNQTYSLPLSCCSHWSVQDNGK